MNPHNFFAELKRRNVYKVAVAYAVVGWLFIQIATMLLPVPGDSELGGAAGCRACRYRISNRVMISWAFEATPEGIKRAEDID